MALRVIETPSFLSAEELEELPLFERLRYVRKDILGVTQVRFAALAKVNLRTVKGWEHPDLPRGAPSSESSQVLARLAGGRYPAAAFTGPPPLERAIAQEILARVDELDRKLGRLLDHLGI